MNPVKLQNINSELEANQLIACIDMLTMGPSVAGIKYFYLPVLVIQCLICVEV